MRRVGEQVIVVRWGTKAVAVAMMLAATLVGCGSGDDGSSQGSSQGAGPPVAQLKDALLLPADLAGEWAVESQGTQGGVIELCADASAESAQAAAALEFQVGTSLREAAPAGATGAVSVAEYLLVGEVDEVDAIFDALQAGAEACYGKPLVPEEDYGTNEPYALPAVGDERYGEYHVMGSETPGYGMYLHMAVVRDGPVLMLLNVWEFLGGGDAQPRVTAEDVGSIVTTAADKLP